MTRIIVGAALLVLNLLPAALGRAALRFTAAPGLYARTACVREGNSALYAPGICSFDLDNAGDLSIFARNRYLIRDPGGPAEETLYDFGTEVYGSFLRIMGPAIYFGESSAHTVKSVPLSGGTPADLFSLSTNYDCDFDSQSRLLLTANPGWAGTKAYAWWSGLTAPVPIADLGGSSGPVAVDPDDRLFYGFSSYPPAAEDVVYFTADQVAGAIASGIPLSASEGTVFTTLTAPAGLVFDRNQAGPNLYVSSGAGFIWRVANDGRPSVFARGDSPFTLRFQAGAGDFAPFLPGTGRLFALSTDWADYTSAVVAFEPCPQNFILDSGDWLGDGKSRFAVFRSSSGLWAIRGLSRFFLGTAGDLPVSGDYAGDGTAEAAVFRSSSGLWVIRDASRFHFGKSGDIPLPRDYTGGGVAVAAVFTPTSGLWAMRGVTRFCFGEDGDFPLPGDWNGDGTARAAVFRPSSGLWSVRGLTRFYFGEPGDLPVPGNFGSEAAWEAAIYRPSDGRWSVRNLTAFFLGREGDVPVPADFDGDGTAEAAIRRPADGMWAVRDATRFYFGSIPDYPIAR